MDVLKREEKNIMALGSLTTAFLGAVQASVTVLLTIGFGVVARQYRIIRDSSAKDISRLCVKITLPALMISSVGSELSIDNVGLYAPILGELGASPLRGFSFRSWGQVP